MGHGLDASPHGQNQISGPYAIAAETWAPTVASAHSSHSFMNAGIREQARLLDGIAALETRHGSLAPENAAGPSNPTANATAATPGRRIKWAFCKRNFRALLQKYITRIPGGDYGFAEQEPSGRTGAATKRSPDFEVV
ncbi:hypothetical protein V496_01821 [Pseudogymnoascus sp. VKM F-4515 (FW-2607)]|nr:hypothetical protein V496_01821 [Pseudogymnoascus sp. VKM F-4515 (FW-2607)]